MKLSALFLISSLAPSVAAASLPSRLPFIDDDYSRARVEAARRELPLFVDVWAPW